MYAQFKELSSSCVDVLVLCFAEMSWNLIIPLFPWYCSKKALLSKFLSVRISGNIFNMVETEYYKSRSLIIRWAGYFYLFNLLLCLLVSLRYLNSIDIPDGFFIHVFTVIAFIGHFSSIALVPMLLTIICALLLPKRAFVAAVCVTLFSFLVLFIAIDTMVFPLYKFHINGMVIHLLLGGAAGDIFQFSFKDWFVAIFVAICIIAAELIGSAFIWKSVVRRERRFFGIATAVVLLLIFFAQNFVYSLAEFSRFTPITIHRQYLPFYRPLTMKKFIGRHMGFFGLFGISGKIGSDEPEVGTGAAGGYIHYPLSEPVCKPHSKRMNIILIVVDSWRADAFTREITPNIDSFAEKSWNFSNHHSGGNATRSGIMSIFYGIPAIHNFWMNLLHERKGPVLVHQMLEQGYEVEVCASASIKSPEFNLTVFSEVKDIRLTTPGKTTSERDLFITREFMDFLKVRRTEDRPFFAFLFYDSPHAYNFPPEYKAPFTPFSDGISRSTLTNDTDPAPYFNMYKNSVHFVDHEIGKVLKALEKSGLADNSIIIITADHGEEFNDNNKNFWGHGSNFTSAQIHVPLIIQWPGRGKRTFVHETSHYDIVPTLMKDAFGCDSEFSGYTTGSHLLDEKERPYLIIGGYYDYAIKEPGQINIVTDGMLQVKDYKWKDIPGSVPNREILLDSINKLGKFLK